LDLTLDLGEPLVLSPGLPMHRVLETLHQLLQMSDALLETTKRTVVWAGRR
jgi:hypothetical protein